MMQTQPKPLLVVTQNATSIVIPARKTSVHIDDARRIFPAIHELQPTGIILDYDFLGDDTEKILRRLSSNPFYSKLKIYCYKSRPHTKVDGLLTVLGVQHFIYPETAKQAKTSAATKVLSYLLDSAVATKLADAS
ncbi:hypothetical protein [Mucilaginibacter sp. UYCu711]|uniref:hypothetical protein n=1 Tax=Mucilaginibacter sp. UYCu711 TaxID=3156339 RepID=UPI003D252F29